MLSFFAVLLSGFGFIHVAYAQGVDTSGGVDVDGSWYVGEGLKKGDYFSFRLCELDLNDCARFVMEIWVRGDVTKGSETLWDFETVVRDGSKIVKGEMQIGKIAPEPVGASENLFYYSRAYRSSIVWLSAFATGSEGDRIHGPQEFRAVAWGKVGAIGGAQLTPRYLDTVDVPAGSFDAVVVGWYSGQKNEIWIVDEFPFPVKAKVYAWVTTGIPPVQYEFELLSYKENVLTSPFSDIVSTVEESKQLGCTQFYDFTGKHVGTNTNTMIIEYNYGPKNPKIGCDIEWKINFKNKYHEEQFVDQVHYDIWVVDDKNTKLRSLAEESGRVELYNGFGQVHKFITVKESPGIAKYAIIVYGVGPQTIVPDPELAGFVTIDIEISSEILQKPEDSLNIPDWIKNNAKWWSEGLIGDSDFISGLQFLINQDIMKIPSTSQGTGSGTDDIPGWIKNNAGWWADGLISDKDFVSGIQFLIENGIMKIAN